MSMDQSHFWGLRWDAETDWRVEVRLVRCEMAEVLGVFIWARKLPLGRVAREL